MSTRSTKKVITEPFDLSNIKTTAQAASTMRKRKRIFGLEEAPTFYPTKEEFKDPLAYIEKISTEGAKYGIIKIIPPSDYKPEFCLNTENFRFKTRLQKLNSMEGETRANVNYLEQLTKYHILTGKPVAKIPQLDKRPIDLYKLKNEVAMRGGVQEVIKQKKWAEIGRVLGYARKNCTSMSNALKSAYTKIILPYEIWYAQHKEDAENLLKKKDISYLNDDSNDTCEICHKNEDEENLLLCDGCNRGYHLYCLTPPLSSVPKTDWYCLQCLTAVGKDYGFEDGSEYTLAGFQKVCDKFKKEWFAKANGEERPVTEEDCENEFWRLVNNPHETCQVEYGADLHSTQHGSGFMAPEQMPQGAFDPWNLNVIPVSPHSLFTHIKTDISGMMSPWLYIGMCFSAFCWHNEDHYTYSINYMHWGETKTWYGVPGSDTAKFEESMRKAVPELFEQQPDLLFQLVTMLSPERLLKENVKVYAVDQRPGQFVVTFPKAYHSGFNHGFNFCEAVNFAPTDWVEYGLECVKRYKEFRKQPCFSHDELLVTAAFNFKNSPKSDLEWLKRGLIDMQQRELEERQVARTKKIKEMAMPKEDAREELQCDHCHCYTYLSFIGCACTERVSCSDHISELCECPVSSKTLYLRFSDKELEELVNSIVNSGFSPEKWKQKLNKAIQTKPTIKTLNELLKEGEEMNVNPEDLAALRDFIEIMDQWVTEAERILDLKSDSNKSTQKGRIERIQNLLEKTSRIGYEFPLVPQLNEYLDQLLAYEATITDELLASNDEQLQYPIYEQGKSLKADSKRFAQLRSTIESRSWLTEVEKVLAKPYNAKSIRKLIKNASDLGITEGPWPERLVMIEQEAKRCLQFIENLCRGRQKIELDEEASVFTIGQNRENPQLSFTLEPHLLTRLQNAIARSKVILNQVDEMLTTECTRSNVLERPAVADGQKLMSICREIVFKSEKVQRLSQALSNMSTWNEKVRTTFMHGRQKSLDHVLRETLSNVETITSNFERIDLYCICRKPESGIMVECDICKEWYHNPCVRVPRSVVRSSISYVCPICDNDSKKALAHVSRRPTLHELQTLMQIAQPLMFRPKDYSLIKNIYTLMNSFQSRAQTFCRSHLDVDHVEEIRRYLRSLEGLEVQLPEETEILRTKLQELMPAYLQRKKSSNATKNEKESHQKSSSKTSISNLIHKSNHMEPMNIGYTTSSAVQNNMNPRIEHSTNNINNITNPASPSRLLLKTNGIKRPQEDAPAPPRTQKIIKLTVRPPTQPVVNKKRPFQSEEEKNKAKKQKTVN
ncbi:hypothetical protein G6F70_004532 [Rhizopus microsporus]|uniref:[histone H3]-trimethyl-L-lysine(4) demethylase n=1 Tax=Rhizopus microsporus TaxID=58291 RepID=A0A1X0RKI6_RHIZD|nr:hypothetical protein G6F71_004409 [Rhizopus microsporus]KAG1199892.1 hypothetical protein G6F70_004532 [Rhizopus microsporus]KAG1211571.1 hypothetical protein G6F69_004490 [Rhizopus microsporus]KAG1233646.1 hypothetical protein G6F67_004131 [Rhizopus microsporus]KAG1259266.1 hypothetical protein G6F68_008236 [Rhizopus microsporus]